MMEGGDETGGDRDSPPSVNTAAAATTTVMAIPRLSQFPNEEHISDSYNDPNLEFSSSVLSSLEKYLPPEMLTANREEKAKFMSDILRKYITRIDCFKAKWRKAYRRKILSTYQPRFRGWYDNDPTLFLLPSFQEAISENTEESFRRVISEPFLGVFVFQMFHRDFFEKLIVEVENFVKWAQLRDFPIRRPYNTSKYGAVLDDIGLDNMLNKLMQDFIFPICKVFFPEVCGAMFDSHHGFYIENGEDRDAERGFHVDDSEITLNVCVRKQFEGGNISFGGTRCEKHANTNLKPEEFFSYCHTPGQAILHRGRHRHGAKARSSCSRANMILLCRNSMFREMQTYEKGFKDWCGVCAHEKKEHRRQILTAKRKEMLRIESGDGAQ